MFVCMRAFVVAHALLKRFQTAYDENTRTRSKYLPTREYIYILYSLAKERKTEIHARVVRTVSNCSRGTDEMSSKRARGNSHAPVPVTLSGGRRILAYFENLPLIDRKRTYYNVLQSGFVLNGRIENVIITVVHTVGRNV